MGRFLGQTRAVSWKRIWSSWSRRVLRDYTSNEMTEAPKLWTGFRIPEPFSLQYGENRIGAAHRPFVEKYSKCGWRTRDVMMMRVQHFALRWMKFLVGTVTMTEQLYSRIWQNLTRVTCDEAARVAESRVISFAIRFLNVRQLFLTVDAKQLPAYKFSYPEGIDPYGYQYHLVGG